MLLVSLPPLPSVCVWERQAPDLLPRLGVEDLSHQLSARDKGDEMQTKHSYLDPLLSIVMSVFAPPPVNIRFSGGALAPRARRRR